MHGQNLRIFPEFICLIFIAIPFPQAAHLPPLLWSEEHPHSRQTLLNLETSRSLSHDFLSFKLSGGGLKE